jgi:pantoate kinase
MTERTARAFVPGHVTGLFSVHRHDDPARTGSRGVGLTLTDGVSVAVRPASEPQTMVDGDAVHVESVNRVLDAMGVDAAVHAETDVPLGAGFGVSGAIALGTAYAANALDDVERSENELVRLAHVAEVEAGSGLGDVVAQARGGAPIRLDPGAPPHGRLDGIPETARVEYVTFGEVSTETVLSGGTETLSTAGEVGLDTVRAHPTLESFLAASRTFASDADLLTDDVEAVIEAVADAGGSAAMAMLGRTVFALGTGLSDASYDPAVCRIHPAGATLR